MVEGDKQDVERNGGRRGKGSGKKEKKELPPGRLLWQIAFIFTHGFVSNLCSRC